VAFVVPPHPHSSQQQQQQQQQHYEHKQPFSALKEGPALSEFDRNIKKLVNLDHIDEAPEEEVQLTMKKKQEVTRIGKDGKSLPLPPVAQGIVGQQASLDQINAVKPKNMSKGNVVMNDPPPSVFHPQAAAAGSLVVYRSDGPPPLQRQCPGGFGVVYQQQQQMLYYQRQQQQHYHRQQQFAYPSCAPSPVGSTVAAQ